MLMIRLAVPRGVQTNTTSRESGLTVVKAIVYSGEVIPSKNLFGSAHIEPPLFQRALTLRWIARDAHDLV